MRVIRRENREVEGEKANGAYDQGKGLVTCIFAGSSVLGPIVLHTG